MRFALAIISAVMYMKASLPSPTEVPYEVIIRRESTVNEIRPSLIMAIIDVESAWNKEAVSNKNCLGLMQVSPQHLKYLGYKKQDDLFDPQKNIAAGTRIFKEELDRFGNDFDALRAYLCGAGKTKASKNCGTSYAKLVLERERKYK